ncbi:DeoR/GlpR family DNA-binding transcription regulator [Staphylococcus nepalensis]|uniref:DeoR/GlpR transcriptional regulator n=1 Tax=Staphylococcus nepalensis TaxID=214473 RepID=A0ABS3L2K0_9STAP|nr:DeoR/GlpR family DNA-binding transcription regulator [Staphylococcus nepalensis]MBO1206297.1 DeoR/GlpR transcriptional regulator [Staphylococcus nepalensis]MBO1212306.1 DeoR/GlpR transcriptional regulator [Staphylococcus nepalensis]MBO1217057.1 DeoR/GlpR transcriptional regulator [Staphylococcus nepalensis]MBO1227783.1 DeoR/GlpR transcriptional regulator [Staphylococcus nepalensis]MBO1235319.1 DeoR/GlpR transcriptional regulator [Staphylococcus nepalensis]
MKKFQRYQEIINVLSSYKHVEVKKLAKSFNVTEETIRRDLEYLENQNILKRTHGGATLASRNDLSYYYRATKNLELKKIIAKKALNYLKDKESIMVDSSSTALEAIRLLSSKSYAPKIITNSVNLLYEFSNTNLNFVSTGGRLNKHSGTLIGAQSIETIKNYYTQAVLLSCNTMSTDGFSVGGEEEGLTKKRMLQQSNLIIMLVDSTKILSDVNAYFKFADFNQIDVIITDTNDLPKEFKAQIEHHNIKVV